MEKKWNEEGVKAGEFEAFRQIVEALRAPDGCPWDREQTMESLKPCMINEMTEALAAIDIYKETGHAENLCEELGDVLLQVVLLAQIAREQGLFAMEDVVRGISQKMVRRHPHVFGGDLPELQQNAVGKAAEVQTDEKAAGKAAEVQTNENAAGKAAEVQTNENAVGEAAEVQTDEKAVGKAAEVQTDEKAAGEAAEVQTDEKEVGKAGERQENGKVTVKEIPGQWEAIKRAEKKNRTPEMEQQEKQAFKTAAADVIRHLEAKLETKA